jgi:hypothetical protein
VEESREGAGSVGEVWNKEEEDERRKHREKLRERRNSKSRESYRDASEGRLEEPRSWSWAEERDACGEEREGALVYADHFNPSPCEQTKETRGKDAADAPQHRRLRELLINPLRHRNIREKHKLLHQRVRLEQLLRLHIDRSGRFRRFEVDLDFRGGEVQRAGGHTFGAELAGDVVEESDAFGEGVGEGAVEGDRSARRRGKGEGRRTGRPSDVERLHR